jgi:hypothetical protein
LDDVSDAFDVINHIVIPKSQNYKSSIVQMPVTPLITALPIPHIMLAAVDFDHEARRVTSEVDNEMIDWHLPPKMKPTCFECA